MEERRLVLHVFNGDCAAEAWKRSVQTPERYVVWRENYLEGPLPAATASREEFARIRAEYLHTCAPEQSVEALTRFQCTLEETLQNLGPTDAVMLWFDDCMFDVLLLARILFVLKETSAEVHLCCENRALGNETEFFRNPWSSFPKLTPDTIHLFSDAWRAITSGSTELERLLQSGRMDPEPALKRGLLRYLADHPGDNSLGLTERKLLTLIAGGTNEFDQLFRAFNASEERPFMGDTMCERILLDLESRGYLTRETNAGKHTFCCRSSLSAL